jgi:hypothetical protein
MDIRHAGNMMGGLGAMTAPKPPGTLSINTTNQNLPGGYAPGGYGYGNNFGSVRG